MSPETSPRPPRIPGDRLSALNPCLIACPPPFARTAFRRGWGIALVLTLLPLTPAALVAQQYAQPGYGQSQQYPQQPYQPSYNTPQPNPPQPGYGYGQPQQDSQQPYPNSSQSYPQDSYAPAQLAPQPLDASQLEQLVAPIALYPDTLLAQVLAASTYPAQVIAADNWLRAQSYASPDQVVAGADAQVTWDPSVKALTAFPQVLAQMDRNLQWTTSLGNAYYNQPQDVMETVQVLRQRAQSAGNLQSTPQEAVNNDQGYIQLAPPDPRTVYVPSYNPWDVYGQPVSPYPGFSLLSTLGSFLGSSPIQYGLGIATSAFSHTSWGWLGWGLDWLTHSVLFHNSNYSSQSTSVANWGLQGGRPRSYGDRGLSARLPGQGYADRSQQFYGRGGQLNRTPQPEYARPEQRFDGNRPGESYARGFNRLDNYPRGGSVRPAFPPQQPYNHMQPPINRQQTYPERPGYGYGSYGDPRGGYGDQSRGYGAQSGIYRYPMQALRQPAPTMPRGDFGGRSYGSARPSMGRGFDGNTSKPPHSGGFHPFGGSHGSDRSYGGHAPKGFGSGSHGSGHGGWGGHSGGGHGGGLFSGHGGFGHH